MITRRIWKFSLLVLWATIGSVALAGPIAMEGRDVLFRVGGSSEILAHGARVGVASSPDALLVSVILSKEQAEGVYGLLVSGAGGPEVSVNGRRLDVEPVMRGDGAMFRVSGMYLREGENRIEIRRDVVKGVEGYVKLERFEGYEKLEKYEGWEGTTMFALADTTEDVHFVQVFSDSPITFVAPATDPLQALYDVLFYDCSWTPSMTSSVLNEASVTVRARSLNSSLQTFVLDFDPNGGLLLVSSVDSGPATPALSFSVDSSTKRLSVTLPAPVAAGTDFTVRVNYSGTPNSSSTAIFGHCYTRSTHGSPSVAVVYTFSEPYRARQWWPCKDLPDDKATSSIQRITVPSGQGWQVVSSGKLQGVVNNGGTETWTWVNDYPIATYLLSMCISNYTYVSATYTSRDGQTTMAIKHAIYPENLGVEGQGAVGTLEVMNFFADTFGEYPFLDEKYFTASHNSGSGMEHQTATSMPGGDVMDGRQRRNVHELCHQWFGDMITCRTFDHLWLNEGFATYAEALWVEHQSGAAAYHSYVNNWTISLSSPIVGPNSDGFSGNVVYRRGGWVLHMLRHVVGDQKFFEALKAYAADPQVRYSTAVSDDFKRVVEDVSGKNLASFFNQWLYRSGTGEQLARPTYTFVGARSGGGGSNFLDVTIRQSTAAAPFVMPIDVEVRGEDNSTQIFVVENSLATETFTIATGSFVAAEINSIDPDNWILNLNKVSINTCGLPEATAGVSYSKTLRASHGSTPYSWSAGAGTLPTGLSLSSGGVISGVTNQVGDFSAPITVQDAGGNSATTTLTLHVGGSSAGVSWGMF